MLFTQASWEQVSLALLPLLPLAGFVLLALAGGRLPRKAAGAIGVGSVGLPALLAIMLGVHFLLAPPPGHALTVTLWTWLRVGAFAPRIAFRLDALSLVMVLVVTFVGFLIHLYSAGYMYREEGYHRFFAYMNLFVFSMLTLVLASNLLLLYLGWEGVGLCSYLLIGFWYKDAANGHAAMKAFIITRIGDVALAIALLLIYTRLGTLDIAAILGQAALLWPPGSALASATAALVLGGAVGKSAQLPLQTWLPDAMAGPTPVSALLHAATMVTAGVYLIARLHTLFTLAPAVQFLVALTGVLTLLLAACSALVQTDIKRILAYSTMSQIGYMFLALGVGAWSAAIFHFITHAFFKSLLFLSAGMVISSMHEEHNILKMGGLRKEMPLVFWTFLIGACSLSALPLVTAGFYSKDLIISDDWLSVLGSHWLWAGAWVGAILTALYTFRMVFLTFFGPLQITPAKISGLLMTLPLVTLAVFSIVAGFINLPPTFGNHLWLEQLLRSVLPPTVLTHPTTRGELALEAASAFASLFGIYLAYVLFLRAPARAHAVERRPVPTAIARFWQADWGFDRLYDALFVRPYVWFSYTNRHDVVDLLYTGIGWVSLRFNRGLSYTQNGRVRRYATGLAIGAVILIAIVVLL